MEEITDEERETLLNTPTTVCDGIQFYHLAEAFENISKTSKVRDKTTKLLQPALLAKIREKDESAYSFVRLAMPDADRERNGRYQVQIKKFASLYAKVMQLPKHHADVLALHSYKDPKFLQGRTGAIAGDFASVLYSVLRTRTRVHEEKVTIGEVNLYLDQLIQAKTDQEKGLVLRTIYNKCSAMEQKWLARIIFQDLKIGLSKNRLFRAFHQDAISLYDHCRDLKLVCAILRDPSKRYTAKLSLFSACSPMLSKRLNTWADARKWLGPRGPAPKVCIEDKLDGDRILLHKRGTEVKVFTRNCNDVTAKFGHFFQTYALENLKVHECIVDGEFLPWDDRNKRFNEFGYLRMVVKQFNGTGTVTHADKEDVCIDLENQEGELHYNSDEDDPEYNDLASVAIGTAMNPQLSRGIIHTGKTLERNGLVTNDLTGMWPCYVLFDVLYCSPNMAGTSDGVLMGEPLSKRKEVLKTIVNDVENVFYCLPYHVVDTENISERLKAVQQSMDEVCVSNKEGLVVKRMDSPYILGEASRKNGYWTKLKPEYMDSLAESLDVIVLAGYYANGTLRSGMISGFLLGVKGEHVNATTPEEDLGFYTLCKVGTGYTRDENAAMNAWLKDAVHAYPPKTVADAKQTMLPKHFLGWCPGKRDDIPDVWYDPKKTLVFEISGAEFQQSEQFLTGTTVRFPRVKRWRQDKEWWDVLSLGDLQQRHTKLSGARHKRHRDDGDESLKGAVGKDMGASRRKVNANFALSDVSQVHQKSGALLGKSFRVYSKHTETKARLEKCIAALGGKRLVSIEEPCPDNVYAVASAIDHLTIRNVQDSGLCDILAATWLDAVDQCGTWIDPYVDPTKWILSIRKENRETWIDPFGDLYFRPVNAETLKQLLGQRPWSTKGGDGRREGNHNLWQNLRDAVEDDSAAMDVLCGEAGILTLKYLDAMVFFFDGMVCWPYLKLHIVGAGGTIATDIEDSAITHIVVGDALNTSRYMDAGPGNDMGRPRFRRVVKLCWLEECLEARKPLPVERKHLVDSKPRLGRGHSH